MKNYSITVLSGVLGFIIIFGGERASAGSGTNPAVGHEVIALKVESSVENGAAYFHGEGSQAVVFVPGAVFSKESWFKLASRLQNEHIASISLDGKRPADVLAAIKFLNHKGYKSICLVGGSMGGSAVLQSLEDDIDEHVDKVVLLAPAGGKSISSTSIKKLFIVSREDRLGIYDDVRQLYLKSAEPKEFIEFEGSEHAQHLFKSNQAEKLSLAIINFVSQ